MSHAMAIPASETQLAAPVRDELTDLYPSEAGTILGLNPYQTPLKLWMQKTGREERPDLDEVERVQMGKLLEPIICQLYAQKEGVKIRRVNRTLIHPEHEWWRGQIDRHVLGQEQRTLLEGKNCSEYQRDKWGPEHTDEVPDFYQVQVRAYMPMDLQFEIAHLAALIGGNTHRTYYLDRDQEVEELITRGMVQFRGYIIEDKAPPPITVEDLEMLWPQHSEEVKQATDDVLEDVSKLQQIKGAMKELEQAKEELVKRVKMFLGEPGYLAHGDEVIAKYKTVHKRTLSTKLVKEKHPRVASSCTVESSYRALYT